MKNVSPTINGSSVILGKPKESDIIDYLNVEDSEELIRMYGGDTKKNIS